MLLHQLGQYGILLLNLLLQLLDALLLLSLLVPALAFQRQAAVHKPLLLPAVEKIRANVCFFANLRYGKLLNQMPPQQLHLFFPAQISSRSQVSCTNQSVHSSAKTSHLSAEAAQNPNAFSLTFA